MMKIKMQFQPLLLVLMLGLLASCSSQDNDDQAISQIKAFIDQKNVDHKSLDWRRHLPMPPKVSFSADKKYFWQLKTNLGDIKIQLRPEFAPMHVSSTIYLTTLGFYDTLTFHRIIPDFMAQGGDPLGNGTAGPGYQYAGEFNVAAKHDKAGILSMANAGPNTDGSQFFITFKATPHLNGRHTVFGEVVSGMDTLQKIEKVGSPSGMVRAPVTIVSATILVE